jgi:hypothetical protein
VYKIIFSNNGRGCYWDKNRSSVGHSDLILIYTIMKFEVDISIWNSVRMPIRDLVSEIINEMNNNE